jgi:type III pantothenate kinase
MKIELSPEDQGEKVKVIGTGGLATLIAGGIDCIDFIDKELTLEGLQIIYEKNKPESKKAKSGK